MGKMGRMSKSEGWEGGEEGFAALRLPFGVTMSFAAVGTARFAIAQLVLQNHREHDMVPFGREHFVVASLREPHTGLAADSCCKTSSSASRFNERGCGAKIVESVWLREGNNIQ